MHHSGYTKAVQFIECKNSASLCVCRESVSRPCEREERKEKEKKRERIGCIIRRVAICYIRSLDMQNCKLAGEGKRNEKEEKQ